MPRAPTDVQMARRRFAGREESDVIVALLRTAFIIAYYLLRAQGYPQPFERLPPALWQRALGWLDGLVLIAAFYNLLLLSLYLRGVVLRPLRPLALLLDLLMLSFAITIFRQAGYDAFDLYYLIIFPAAIWFRRLGAVVVALLATALAALTPALLWQSWPPAAGWLSPGLSQGVWLILIGLIAGYLVRARDMEHAAATELRQEMMLARALQAQLLPQRLPESPAYEIGVVFEPARHVGGDFYDLRLLDEDHLLIVLADMCGKSVYGLMHLSLVRAHLQAALADGLPPAEAARRVNAATYEALQPEAYAALFVGVWRLSDGRLRYVNCGHTPPLLVRNNPNEEALALTTGSPVIGLQRDSCFTEQEIDIAPGDILLCFSDGVSEARNDRREPFGQERLVALIRQEQQRSAQIMAEAVWDAVRRFAKQPGLDDITVIALRRRAQAHAGEGAAQ